MRSMSMVEVLVDRIQSGPHTRSKSVKQHQNGASGDQRLANHACEPALLLASLDASINDSMHRQRWTLVP